MGYNLFIIIFYFCDCNQHIVNTIRKLIQIIIKIRHIKHNVSVFCTRRLSYTLTHPENVAVVLTDQFNRGFYNIVNIVILKFKMILCIVRCILNNIEPRSAVVDSMLIFFRRSYPSVYLRFCIYTDTLSYDLNIPCIIYRLKVNIINTALGDSNAICICNPFRLFVCRCCNCIQLFFNAGRIFNRIT